MRELLTKTIEVKPDFLQARLWLARYYTQVDSLDNAKAEYDEVLKQIGPQYGQIQEGSSRSALPAGHVLLPEAAVRISRRIIPPCLGIRLRRCQPATHLGPGGDADTGSDGRCSR